MATCTHCTRTVPDDAKVCTFCGSKISSKTFSHAKEDLLFRIRENMKEEQKRWRLMGLALTIVAALCLAGGVWSFLTVNKIALAIYIVLFVLCLIYVPVNLIQYVSIDEYVGGIYLDCGPAIQRSDSRRSALTALFFNPWAMRAFLKNRAFIDEHRAALDEVRRDQDQKYDSTFRNDLLHGSRY